LQLLKLMLAIFSLMLQNFESPLILLPYLDHLYLRVKVLKVKLQDL